MPGSSMAAIKLAVKGRMVLLQCGGRAIKGSTPS